MSQANIAMVGAAGRMGKRIISLINEDPATRLTAAIEGSDSPFLGQDAGELAGCGKLNVNINDDIITIAGSDVAIDFTGAAVTLNNLDKYKEADTPLVIGSTGFGKDEVTKIEKLAESIPVVLAPNMSLGVNLTFKILEIVSGAIGEDFDIEIMEAHHRMKKDAPSGTALKMAEVIAEKLKRNLDQDAVFCRRGLIGERSDKEIGIQTIRGGDIVGEHTAMFCGAGERIEITHKASSRDTFAKGAITAAKWLREREAGLYSMFDVLGL